MPASPLSGTSPGSRVDLFVRPQHLHVADGAGAAFEGKVAATIYQGDHVDLYIDAPDATSGRLMMRLAARDAGRVSDIGSTIAIGISGEDAVAFPPPGA